MQLLVAAPFLFQKVIFIARLLCLCYILVEGEVRFYEQKEKNPYCRGCY